MSPRPLTNAPNALSFYRSQNFLGCSKFFVPEQKIIYILQQSQTFCARQKDDLHSVELVFEKALNAVKFLGLLKKFGLAVGGTKHFGACKRTMQRNLVKACQISLTFKIVFNKNELTFWGFQFKLSLSVKILCIDLQFN